MLFEKTSRCISYVCVKSFSSNSRKAKEVSIKVPWGHIAGKWWEPYNVRPILAIHGWQDNCGTFDRLIPMLNKDVGFLAIDLPGHGYSSKIPDGMYYDVANYLLTVRYVYQHFNWPTIALMGHSLGGIISYMYTMFFPDQIDFTICLEGLKPLSRKYVIHKMSESIVNFEKYSSFLNDPKEPPSYSIEEIKKKISEQLDNAVDFEVSQYLMERNTAPSKLYPGKYYFTRDPRLKLTASTTNFLQEDLVKNAALVTSPLLVIKALGVHYFEPKENFYQVMEVLKRTSADYNLHYVEGKHHVHLNNPERVAGLVTKFVERHQDKIRNDGGVREDIILNKN